ncbi:MAG: GFA family protein [Amaricoccus sp.]
MGEASSHQGLHHGGLHHGGLHHGSCQCGAVAFDVTVDISKPVTCNCSRCQRLGSRLAFAPESAFTLLRGAEALTEYTFNRHVIRHQFCRICGIETFAFAPGRDGTPMVAINVNCLDGVDPTALETQHFDGAAA